MQTAPFVALGPLHPHLAFEVLAYAVGFAVYRRARARAGDVVAESTRWAVFAAATVGAALGSKGLALLVDPARFVERVSDPRQFVASGKTIVGALLGGWLAVELVKRPLGVRQRTGDLFALPLCVGIAIGRIGCFLTGLPDQTYGVATDAPWGIDFGDGVARHPAQLYELLFLAVLGVGLVLLQRRRPPDGAVFRAFLFAYLVFRLAVDAIKPTPRFAGLGTLQWAALAGCCALAIGARPATFATLARARGSNHGAS